MMENFLLCVTINSLKDLHWWKKNHVTTLGTYYDNYMHKVQKENGCFFFVFFFFNYCFGFHLFVLVQKT